MAIQRGGKNDKKYVKGNNSKTVDYDAKQEKRRELAERLKRPAAASPAKEAQAGPKRGKSS